VLSFGRISGYSTISSTVPNTSNVSAMYNLYQMSSLDVSNFDKAGVEQQDIGYMQGDTNCRAFPFNYTSWSPGFAIIVHEKPEFYSKVSVEAGYFASLHTIITKQKFLFTGPEDTYRTARFATLWEVCEIDIIALRNGNTLITTLQFQ
jgi:hypothetical protein